MYIYWHGPRAGAPPPPPARVAVRVYEGGVDVFRRAGGFRSARAGGVAHWRVLLLSLSSSHDVAKRAPEGDGGRRGHGAEVELALPLALRVTG